MSVKMAQKPSPNIKETLSVAPSQKSSDFSLVTQFTYDKSSLDEKKTLESNIVDQVNQDFGEYLVEYGDYSASSRASSLVSEQLTDTDLIKTIDKLQIKAKRFKIENRVFQNFLELSDPDSFKEIQLSTIVKKSSVDSGSRPSDKLPMNKSFMKKSVLAVLTLGDSHNIQEETKINVNTKIDLLAKDLEDRQIMIDSKKEEILKVKNKLIAKLEEIEIRKEETEQSLLIFQNFKNGFSKQMTLFHFGRFMDEWSKKSRLQTDKIRLRYSYLKSQLQKLLPVLAHKKLIGENLQEIDYEKVYSENIHLTKEIEKTILLLLELKIITGAGNLKLSQHKSTLQEKMIKKENLKVGVKKLTDDINKTDCEIMKVYDELEEVKQKHKKVNEKYGHFNPPDTLDYIKEKAKIQGFQKAINTWTRRKRVENLALEMEINRMKKVFQCKSVHPCWFQEFLS